MKWPHRKRRRGSIGIPPRRWTATVEAWVMASFMVSSASLVLFGPVPSSAAIVDLGRTVQYGLATCIIAGALTCIAGLRWKDPIMSAVLELAGIIGVITPVAVWVWNVAGNTVNWTSGMGAVALLFLWAAFAQRSYEIGRWLKWVYTVQHDDDDDNDEVQV